MTRTRARICELAVAVRMPAAVIAVMVALMLAPTPPVRSGPGPHPAVTPPPAQLGPGAGLVRDQILDARGGTP